MNTIKQSLLAEAGKIVNGARREAYGTPEDNFERIATFWQAYFQNTGRRSAKITAADVSPLMRLMKEARLCESPDHRDSFVDIIGYALTGGEINLPPEYEGEDVDPEPEEEYECESAEPSGPNPDCIPEVQKDRMSFSVDWAKAVDTAVDKVFETNVLPSFVRRGRVPVSPFVLPDVLSSHMREAVTKCLTSPREANEEALRTDQLQLLLSLLNRPERIHVSDFHEVLRLAKRGYVTYTRTSPTVLTDKGLSALSDIALNGIGDEI